MDVKMAFLNGYLEEDVYMNQPEGFIAPREESTVCRLVKSLYDLKQALKQWHQKFDHTMLESGCEINERDKCAYVKDTSSGYIIRTQNGVVLSQAHYVDKISDTQNTGNSSLARIPMDTRIRPDLAYVVSRLSRYTSNPSDAHCKAMTRLLQLHYLRYNHDYGLHYGRYPTVIEGYNDVNWISGINDSRSTNGYVFTL
ncbi:retrotransposon protein, putative, ty1-copia subclass [Tanacetum coccineum]